MSRKLLGLTLACVMVVSLFACAFAEEGYYPVTIEHHYGSTTIESQPERVVTLNFGNQDSVLALGVVPVGVSMANFGAVDENGLLPWTAKAYEDLNAEPAVFSDLDGFDYEAVSDAQPDVILLPYSGCSQEEYDRLSEIAPTIPWLGDIWYVSTWQEQLTVTAQALNKVEEGEKLLTETTALIAEKTEAAGIVGKRAAFCWINAADLSQIYVYLPLDPRGAYLEELGLELPQVIKDAATPEDFTVTVSAENIDLLKDVDIIICYGDDTMLPALQANALYATLPAVQNGAIVTLDASTALAASGSPSVLSIPYTIDEYVGLIADAAAKIQ